MPNPNPLRGIVPRAVHPVNDGETTISQYVEKMRAAAEEAKLLLKNRLEVDATKHRFHSELGVFKDGLRIIND